jgi:hypothetical protein
MLHALGCADYGRIPESRIGEVFADMLVAFIDDALDPLAFLPFGALAQGLERALEARDLVLGFTEVRLERCRQLVRGDSLMSFGIALVSRFSAS